MSHRKFDLLLSWGASDSRGVFKDAIIAIMATLAKQERVKRSERTKAGLARVRAAGRRLGVPRKLNGQHTAEIACLTGSGAISACRGATARHTLSARFVVWLRHNVFQKTPLNPLASPVANFVVIKGRRRVGCRK